MELLERVRWTSETPAIYVNIYYEYQRSGSDMQYRTKLVIEPVKGQSYFGWQIIANITSEGVQRANPVIKQNSPSQWTSNIEWTSDWWTVSNKTSGSSSLSVQLYSNGSSRNQTYNYSMYVAPAYTSVSKWTITSKTETSITLSWQTAHTCSQIRYGTSTSSYTTANVNASSGSVTINNLSANTNYTLYFMPCRKDSGLWGDGSANTWKSATQQTYNYPYASAMPNFTIESGVVITLYNPLGRAVSLTGIGANNTTIFTGTTSSTSATITMSASDITAQYNSIPNTKSATYQVKTTYGSSNITKTGGTYSTNASLCSPIFTNFRVIDDNEITTALTDNNHYNVNGYTTALVIIHNEDKAEPQKGATMSKYLFAVGNGTPIEIPYTNLETSGSIPNAPSGVYNVWAVDSRGNSTLVTKTAEQEIAYTNIVKDQIKIERQNDVGEQTTLTFNGTFWGSNFGLADNSITNVRYRYKQTGDDWPAGWNGETTITPTTSGNNYTFTNLIKGDTNSGFDVSHSYNIEVEVSDELSSIVFSITLGSGTPNIAIHKEGVAINGMYDENDTTNKLQINGNTKVNGNIEATQVNGYQFDFNTINTGDSWVPVLNGNKLQHRVIPNTINENLLQLTLMYTTDGSAIVNDSSTKTYQLERGGFYLFIDSHPYNNSIGIINGYQGNVKYIIETSGHLVFTYNTSNYQMTVRTVNGARFKLYLIRGQGNI